MDILANKVVTIYSKLMIDKIYKCTVKPVYKGHSLKPGNVVLMSSCPLYTD